MVDSRWYVWIQKKTHLQYYNSCQCKVGICMIQVYSSRIIHLIAAAALQWPKQGNVKLLSE